MHPQSLLKVFFLVAVGSILAFGPGLFITWALVAAASVMTVDDAVFRMWRRRLLALAVVDTVLVFSFLGVAAGDLLSGGEQRVDPFGKARPVIGLTLDENPAGQVRVASVVPGGPADAAGIEVGDVLMEIDGEPVSSAAEARKRVGDATAGEPLSVRRSRGGTQSLLELRPIPSEALPRPKRGLFEPQSSAAQCLPFQTNPSVPWALLIAAAVVGGLWWLGRQHGMDATLLWCGALLLGTTVLTQAASIVTCVQVGGPSRGGILVALAVQTVAFIAGGALLMRRMKRIPSAADTAPKLSVVQTCLLGALFLVGGGVRVGAALSVVLSWAGQEASPYEDSIVHEIARSGLSPGGVLLFVAVVAFLGPIGEELVFRGVVLPWLARWMKPFTAIAVSGVLFGALHLFYGPFVLVAVYYGLVLGWTRVRSGGLVAPIALHIAVNGTVSAILLTLAARSE